jgi:hypothetical protein
MNNIGGGWVGPVSLAGLGGPARYTLVLAEDAAVNPWEPLHVELGFAATASVLVVMRQSRGRTGAVRRTPPGGEGAGQERRQALAVRARPDAGRRVPSLVALEHDRPPRRMAAVGSGGSTRAVRRARGPRARGRHDRRRRRRSRDSPARLFPFVGFPALSDREGDNDLASAAAECDHYLTCLDGLLTANKVAREFEFTPLRQRVWLLRQSPENSAKWRPL